jgi:thiamine pyrophosphokinase
MKRALILANGNPPSKQLFKKYTSSNDVFICADGGANIALRFKIKPNLIIGDLDSIFKETLRKFRKVEIKLLKDQNSTDLEKALAAAIKMNCSEIIVLGAIGGRLDHAIGNLSALSKYSRRARIKFVDDAGEFIPIIHTLKINIPTGTLISLLPISRCSGIITKGLKWNLRNDFLQFGIRESTSNKVVSSPVSIKVKKGNLIAFIMNRTV